VPCASSTRVGASLTLVGAGVRVRCLSVGRGCDLDSSGPGVRRISTSRPFVGARKLRAFGAQSRHCSKSSRRRVGTSHARVGGVSGARHFSELTAWKLADELRVATLKLTARAGFASDFRAKSQAEDAVNSVCRNIAEGFARLTRNSRGLSASRDVRSTSCRTSCEASCSSST
jgi:hypothetical protein